MTWYQILLLITSGLLLIAMALMWYQPEARHAAFAAGQVWKNSAGFTMKVLSTNWSSVGEKHTLDIKRTTPDGMVEHLRRYPRKDFRRLIIKNRYKLV